ncbi:MAG: ParB/RepB/Spo0J family partition protein [Alphaproteobacteria bacterium]|nr:ParB/RepB/Spo0J family partition protein [Alphaproteobacteria bacterium]
MENLNAKNQEEKGRPKLKPQPQGLGRGLNALFSDEESTSFTAEVEKKIIAEAADDAGPRKPMTLGTDKLMRGAGQPRKVFHDQSIDELALSIREHGILQPLLVRKVEGGDMYEIIAGERRWQAAQRAQLHDVPVIMLDVDDLEAFKIALIENLQREDLDPIDEAHGYQRLLEEFGQSKEQLAKSIGKSRSHISNMTRLLTLPGDVQVYVATGDLSMGHARALITAEDPTSLAKQVILKGLTVRQTEKLAAQRKGIIQEKRPRSSSPAMLEKDADTIALENDISNSLGMRVSIDTPDGKSGKLAIEFKSLDQLDDLLHRLAHYPGSKLSG